ncbi:hypothetical protein GGI04_000986 [Coemansia thaxteri]|uniref:ABC transporter domain-containing protein n=1 Tax=Coemansia thaxteri TaxID=2663907 RepID=A0A9W8BMV8_9FUNG|nr:hypothetical protein H4R26_001026 [Coemansia thaxteri]KAJ2008792.1 hypothetical protein GGI04_000986 [Coemansia thaxteri]KAJ2471945.1 hypothetical protein GGI02_001931 [Coemansia sp. RSA 2322]KAJ2487104.1 hypothetical protein EV174_000715 [Coemansia sp. RSA 2320]
MDGANSKNKFYAIKGGSSATLQYHQSKLHSKLQCDSDVILRWNELNYEVRLGTKGNQQQRTILHGTSGQAKTGEIIAIIGSSGAGKTTLLNALSGRIVGGRLSGQILFRGAKRHPGSFKRVTAYVQQDDLMHPLLTVQETLSYASKLRLPNNQYSAEQKAERVNTVIRQLRLEAARNTKIGDAATRGVSGGERKRVSIGTELLTDPRLLFLDEPTSGLDSNSSELVVELVKKVSVEQGLAALMTIHQPSARIFNIFDKVILLSQGRVVYFGPTSTAIEYFANIGYQCPVHENPADYFTDLMTLDYRSDDALARSKIRVNELSNRFAGYASLQPDYPGNGRKQLAMQLPADDDPASKCPTSHNSWFYEYATLARRDWVNIIRNTSFFLSQMVQPLVMGLFMGFMYFVLGNDSVSVQNRLGVLYIIVVQGTFPIFMPQLAVFSAEQGITTRERASASYRASTYYASKTTTFIPIALVANTIFYACIYFISGLALSVDKFFIGLALFHGLTSVSISLMFVFGAAVQSVEVAYVLSTGVITTQLLYTGLFANFHTVSQALRWIRWLNPVYYAYAALAQNEFRGMDLTCSKDMQCYESGDQVVKSYGLDQFTIGQNGLFIVAIGAIFYVGGYACLRWKAKPKFTWI